MQTEQEYQARRFANEVMGTLSEFIPTSCTKDAATRLFDMAMRNGLSLTSKPPRCFGENPGTVKAQG